jgi:hypothetical protein
MGEPKRQSAAEQKPVIPDDDPVLQAVRNTPLVPDEYECDEEREQVEASTAELRAGGRTYSSAEMRAMIDERREREG